MTREFRCDELLGCVRQTYGKLFFEHQGGGISDIRHDLGKNHSLCGDEAIIVTCQAGYGKDAGTASALWWNDFPTTTALRLSYMVTFEHGFDWVKGGKLPGIGPYDPDRRLRFCFRPMWREDGASELYLHLPVDPPEGKQPWNYGKNKRGEWFAFTSVCREQGWFAAGEETRVDLEVDLDQDGNAVAILALRNHVVARWQCRLSDLSCGQRDLGCIHFTVFFGGGTADYAGPRPQQITIKELMLYR